MWESLKNFLKHPEWRTQHGWRRAIWQNMNRLGLTGLHGLPMSRRWVDIHRTRMPLPYLDPAFVGFKIVQLSDLHYSPVVSARYLLQFVKWVDEINPDLIVVTGDLITGGYRFAHRVATILKHFQAPHGVICTLGNHDYSIYGKSKNEGDRRADYLEKCLKERGLICLRNETIYISHNNSRSPLAIVGLDDEWSAHLDADIAFKNVGPHQPIICLNHNPANVKELLPYPWQWMLSGHTHGRQVATSKFGQTFYPDRYRHYTRGYYPIEGRHLYVNRGLSYGQRVMDWCRPEITVFRLESSPRIPN